MSNEAIRLIDESIARLEATKRVINTQGHHSLKDVPVNKTLMENQPNYQQWNVERSKPVLKAELAFANRSPAQRYETMKGDSFSEFLTYLGEAIDKESEEGHELIEFTVTSHRSSKMTSVPVPIPGTDDLDDPAVE